MLFNATQGFFSIIMKGANNYNDLLVLPAIEAKLNIVRNKPGTSSSAIGNGTHQQAQLALSPAERLAMSPSAATKAAPRA